MNFPPRPIHCLAIAMLATCVLPNSATAQSSTRMSPSPARIQRSNVPRLPRRPELDQPFRNGGPLHGVPIQAEGRAARTAEASASSKSSTPDEFEMKLWNFINRAKYKHWSPAPGQGDGMYEGQSPHGAYLKMYLNRKAAGSPNELPYGSIIIKENFEDDGYTLSAITLMYRVPDYNLAAGDWYWVKYNPDGTVPEKETEDGKMVPFTGKLKSCIECHADAEGDDYVFFNDQNDELGDEQPNALFNDSSE